MHIDTIYNVDEKKIEELAKKQELNSEDRAIIEEAAHHCYIPALRIYREYDMDAVVEICIINIMQFLQIVRKVV